MTESLSPEGTDLMKLDAKLIIGDFLKMKRLRSLIGRRRPSEPMIKIHSRKHEAFLPASLVRKIVEEASPKAFFPDNRAVRMDGGQLSDILEQMNLSDLPPHTRRSISEAIDVGIAAAALTFVGDVIIEADEETISLAAQKGASKGYASANLIMSIATDAALKSRRILSSAG